MNQARPLVFVVDGDVYSYAKPEVSSLTKPQRLTSWAHNWGPSPSPDNRFVVYGSDARLAVQTCAKRDDCGAVSLPSNIWLRDLKTNRSSRIADQPKGDPIRDGIQRSRPIWSPDGSRIAWTQIQGSRYRLAIYSLASHGTAFNRLDMPLPGSGTGDADSSDDFVPDPILWGAAGIVVPVPSVRGGSRYSAALLIDANGVKRRLNFPHEINGWLVFARDGANTVIAGHAADFVIDPSTGTASDLNGQLEAFMPGVNDGLSVVASKDGCELYRNEVLIKPLPNSNNDLFGCDTYLSPDGSAVAYSQDNALNIDDGRSVKQVISGSDYVAVWDWGQLEYRIWR
jgi:WD40-like Beta Propeller Repeat